MKNLHVTMYEWVVKNHPDKYKDNPKEYRDTISPIFVSKNTLFLSSFKAITYKKLIENDIKTIITIGSRLRKINLSFLSTYKCFNVEGSGHPKTLEVMNDLLHKSREIIAVSLLTGNVLVHCGAGVSRSPKIVLDYLINKAKLEPEYAIQLLKTKRDCVVPHLKFIKLVIDIWRTDCPITNHRQLKCVL